MYPKTLQIAAEIGMRRFGQVPPLRIAPVTMAAMQLTNSAFAGRSVAAGKISARPAARNSVTVRAEGAVAERGHWFPGIPYISFS